MWLFITTQICWPMGAELSFFLATPRTIILRLLPVWGDKLEPTGAGRPEVGMVSRWGRSSCPARSRKPLRAAWQRRAAGGDRGAFKPPSKAWEDRRAQGKKLKWPEGRKHSFLLLFTSIACCLYLLYFMYRICVLKLQTNWHWSKLVFS